MQERGKHGKLPSKYAEIWLTSMQKLPSISKLRFETVHPFGLRLISLSGRLSEILRHQAILLEHIVTDQRYYPDYYKVTFYGNFPTAIRDKRFIVCFPYVFQLIWPDIFAVSWI
jgi:hypothetical protein